jgi:choline dehydrogenase-like flavoprotein
LSQAGLRVVMVEDGPAHSRFKPSWSNVQRFHYQEDYTMIAEGPVPLPVAAGRGVGGGSLVNSAICFRTPRYVLEHWADLLDDDRFLPDAMAEVYEEIEARIEVVPVTADIAGENNLLVERGVRKLGLQGGLLRRNAPGCVGCGICNLGCPTGGKFSVDKNLILDARNLGTRIQADCRVEQVLVEGGRAVGVVGRLHHPETRQAGSTIEVRAKAVVLSAGAIGTPRLLHFCGLASDLGPVGETLHLHPGSGILGRCATKVHMWRGATQGAYVHDLENPKVLPHTFNAPPEVFIATAGLVGADAKRMLSELNYLCGLGVMVSDSGKGSVRARKNGRAKIKYEWNPDDVEILKAGIVLSGRVLLAGGAEEVFALAYKAKRHTTVESLQAEMDRTELRDLSLYASHPMGTSPMGPDPETSVLDARGRAHRLDGLYMADAGIFPSALGVNPQLTTMTLSTVLAAGWVDTI